ncbi:MAG: type II CRISPR RNA-guided endonuclease Cas9 [Gammaproteobacteria bacterium]|nr:type II CRISPR RNA-guided endonuclease Cas9 [Gammaproteobacteria bacterium]
MSLRFSFDLGTNSIGWAVYRTLPPKIGETRVPVELCDAGVRVFPDSRDPKSQQSLAADRRKARGMRRRRDRYLERRGHLMNALVECGLMPQDEAKRKALESLDPYDLRARALDKKLAPEKIGRVLFHLNQRRGFKSNRKTDAGDKEAEGMKAAIEKLDEKLGGEDARTIGEWLAGRHQGRSDVRFRGKQAGNKMEWEFYPQRAMLEHEFDAIWAAQERHHPALLTDAARDKIQEIIFYQRPLKPVPAGKCTFEAEEDRAPKALPTAEHFRILQDLNHLKVRCTSFGEQQPLTLEERNKLLNKLASGAVMAWKSVCKTLGYPPDTTTFNFQSEKRKELKGDETARRIGVVTRGKNIDKTDFIGKKWHGLPLAKQDDVVEKLLGNEDDNSVCGWLMDKLKITQTQAQHMINTSLPPGYARLSKKAMAQILPHLEGEVITYNEACKEAGYDHANPVEETGEVFNRLPPYQEIEAFNRQLAGTGDPNDPPDKRYGRYPNPTVHVGLNQMRRVVNALAEKHGVPSEIVLEIARDLKNSADERKRISKQQAENQTKNDARDEKIRKLGFPVNGENRMRLRLWEDLNRDDPLNRCCPYTGKQISIGMLFSGEVDIDHILPWSRTLDNSAANRTVCILEANRRKGDHSPAEAVERGIFQQDDIDRATANLPGNKQWRFAIDAMERFENTERDFLDRQLHETAWLSRLARIYLSCMCHNNHVWVVTGQLTAMLRGKWGLNSILGEGDWKQRTDHRHHAVDAAVIGAIDRGMLNRAARDNARKETDAELKLDIAPPLDDFRDRVREVVDRIIVSHKPDHGIGGQLHEETAYGIVKDPKAEDGTLVARKPVAGLTKAEIKRIRNTRIRKELLDLTEDASAKELPEILAEWSRDNGIRRLRILKKEQSFIEIDDRKTGEPYRAVIAGENHHLDVFEMPGGELKFSVATVFDVNQPGWKAEVPEGGRLVMRLHKGDMVKIDGDDGARKVMRVQRIEVSAKRIRLIPHNEAGDFQKRHDDPNDSFRWEFFGFGSFTKRRLRPVIVSPTGKVKRRPPPEK